MNTNRFNEALRLFDEYNGRDPKKLPGQENVITENQRYGIRMTDTLSAFDPQASESLQLAARCQHIGRWEIPRSDYPMNRKGYLQWRVELKKHHARIARDILSKVGYDDEIIDKVGDLLMKKQLKQNPETQALEDVICLVFLTHYFDDFSSAHDDEKVISILRKTLKKMSKKGIASALELPLSETANKLISQAMG